MPAMTRWLRAAAQPLIFLSVAALSWWLVSSFMAPPPPGSCSPDAERESPPDLTPLQAGVYVRSSTVAASFSSLAAPRGPAPVSLASSRAVSVSNVRLLPDVEDVRTEQPEQVVLLDGGQGPRPANMMNCPLTGEPFQCGECATDGDCPAGRGCVINYEKGVFECVESECEEDSHCFPGTVCRVAAGAPPGPLIRRCLPAGSRTEGQGCSRLPANVEEACQEGLLCVNHLCGRPCVPGVEGACPEGHVCEEGSSGAACLPDCRKLGCPAGKQCARLNEGVFQCLELVVDECGEQRPCADGANCIVRGRAGRAGRFCAAPCESWRPGSCGSGEVCGVGGPTLSACYRACDPRNLDSCPAGWLCTTVSEDLQSWGCLPDFH